MAEHLIVDQGHSGASSDSRTTLANDQRGRLFFMQKSQCKVVHSIAEFLIDREAAGVAPSTLEFYTYNLAPFQHFADAAGREYVEDITPGIVRAYLVEERKCGRSDGGVASLYTALRAWLRWYEAEYEPADWRNPVDKVQAPRRPTEVKDALDLHDFEAIVATCAGPEFEDTRDRAMLYFLIDTGVRKSELLAFHVDDLDMATGTALVRSGKGRKTRQVFFGAMTKKWLGRYLVVRQRVNHEARSPELWLKADGYPLTAGGARQMLRRRSERAGVEPPGFHAFRRTFAISALRSGMDLVTLQRILGHSNLSVIQRYLPLVSDDLRQSHKQYDPLKEFMSK